MALLALLRAQSVAYELSAPESAGRIGVSALARRVLVGVVALLWIQIALGGWVSTNYAVLACRDFPTCQGSWWPDMDFAHGFTLWRELGMTQAGYGLPFAALTAIHYVHRLSAYVVFAGMGWLAWLLWSTPATRRIAKGLLLLAAWQFASGLTNVVLDWPLLAALAHIAGAAALVILTTGALASTRSVSAPAAAVAMNLSRSAR
jgi:cytochrome c oxidase assembly protein subunit 15